MSTFAAWGRKSRDWSEARERRQRGVKRIGAGIWEPRKAGSQRQVNSEGRPDEENFTTTTPHPPVWLSIGSSPSLGNAGGWDVPLKHPSDAASSSDLRHWLRGVDSQGGPANSFISIK